MTNQLVYSYHFAHTVISESDYNEQACHQQLNPQSIDIHLIHSRGRIGTDTKALASPKILEVEAEYHP